MASLGSRLWSARVKRDRDHRASITLAVALALGLLGPAAAAAPKAPAAAAPKKGVATATPALPAPAVTLRLTPGAAGAPWSIQVHNAGEGPVRIPADPRLLALDLSPPAPEAAAPAADQGAGQRAADQKKKAATKAAPAPLHCVLPDDTRPHTDEGPDLVIPSGRSWTATFDPAFYCFGAKERAALVSGTSVKARFGWPAPRAGAPAAPFVVNPVGASVDKVAPMKELESAEVALTETIAAPSSEGPKAEADPTVTLAVPDTLDAARGAELNTTVTLKNGSGSPITLLYRPELITFRVTGPSGPISCGYARQVAAPIRELFTTVGAHGRADLTVLFSATCPAGTFDDPGLYRVDPILDTTGASGRPINLRTWDGVARATSPLLVRVRTPRKLTVPPRPALD